MPHCLEKKLTLSGEVQTFSCELVHLEPGFGMLRYVIDREYHINGIRLLPGDVTCALYWTDRPYTLYVWRLGRERRPLYYFNIADSVLLSPAEFAWRDLAVDILIDTQGTAHVLDEHELPEDLDKALARYIKHATEHVLGDYRNIVREADALIPRCLK